MNVFVDNSSKERKKRYRERRRAKGFKAYEIWAYPKDYPKIKKFIRDCTDKHAME